MKRKNTDQLLKELMDSNDLSRVLSDNSACFREGDLPHGLQMLFDQQDMSKSALAKASGISEVYLHQVFSDGAPPPATGCCVCVSGWAPRQRRPRVSCSRHTTRRCTPGTSGTRCCCSA